MNKRMNNFRCLLLALPGMLLMAGCDKSASPEQENNESVELQIAPMVALTRSAVQDAKSLDKVAVYATGSDYTAGNNYAVYTNKTNSWDNEGSESIYLTNAAATIYGYYPTTTKYDASETIPITVLEGTDATTIAAIDNSNGTAIASALGEVDYMHATSVSSVNNKSGNNVTLVMNHALSMVSFRVYKAADYKGPGYLTKVVMENVGAGTTLNKGTSPTMNITTGAINEGAAKQAVYTRTITDYTLASTANDSKKFSIMVLPTSSAISNIKATFTIDGADYPVNLTQPTAAGTEGKWKPGYNNLYTVKMGGTDLSITTVTVTPWKETVVNDELDIK